MMKKRALTYDEIHNILDFLTPSISIPGRIADNICDSTRRDMKEQLESVNVYPSIIPKLKLNLMKQYNSSLIHPGECIGILCAQSIGEKNTQTALNTFHKAGQSEKTMTEGVPRFQELINATKNQKIVSHFIYLNNESSDLSSVIDETRGLFKYLTLDKIYTSIFIHDISTNIREPWYDMFDTIYGVRYKDYAHRVRIMLDKKKLVEHNITHQSISEIIEQLYQDVCCVYSPIGCDIIDVYIDISKIDSSNILNNDRDLTTRIYLEEIVISNLSSIQLTGIKGIDDIFYTKQDDIWMIETNSYNDNERTLNDILCMDIVNKHKTVSNNIWNIFNILGVEACRKFLIKEFMAIMDGINTCHVKLLVDRMTFDGTIQSISRYTLKNDHSGVLGKASFEESLDNFLNACLKGETDIVDGVSASIMCGKRCRSGTGMVDLKMKE